MTDWTNGGVSRRAVLGALVAGVGLAAVSGVVAGCDSKASKTASGGGARSTPSLVPGSDADTIDALQSAFRWGYPVMAMAALNAGTYGATANAFYNMKAVSDSKSQRDRGFNADTLYSVGAIDLTKEPLVLSLPSVGDRYVIFPLQDSWGNIADVIGTRTLGDVKGNYLISGPDWKGDVPEGLKHYQLHTNIGFIPGRTTVTSTEDAKQAAATLLDQYTLTPLSRWGTGKPNPDRDSVSDPLPEDARTFNVHTALSKLSINDYFNQLNALLVGNPPYDYDNPVVDRFAPLGIGAGETFDIAKFSPAVQEAMKDFGPTDIADQLKGTTTTGIDPKLAKLTNRFGTHYAERYSAVFMGIGGNLLEDAAYFWLTKDTDGNPLTGTNKYVIRFAADQIPKVKAFWSLTLYDKDFQLPQNLTMERHNRNSRASGMKTGADGSLEVYLQADSPGKDRDDNWLPTPSGGYFLILRTYGPEGDILTGDYTPPPVEKVK